jgi:Autographiviridae endonuclease VII
MQPQPKEGLQMQTDHIATKCCYQCKTVKPVSEFYKHRGRPDGLSALCKSCNKSQCKAAHKRRKFRYEELFAEAYPDEVFIAQESPATKICSRCRQDKSLALFYKDTRYRYGVAQWCIECRRVYSRDYGKIQSQSEAPLPALKLCTRCMERKPPEEFHLQKSKKDGLKSHCKACRSTRESPLRCGEPARRNHLKRKYGLTPEEFMLMLKNQANQCAICASSFTGLKIEVDHCHSSGKVRGLLCTVCNRWLAAVDHPTFISKARIYVANPPGIPNRHGSV